MQGQDSILLLLLLTMALTLLDRGRDFGAGLLWIGDLQVADRASPWPAFPGLAAVAIFRRVRHHSCLNDVVVALGCGL